MRIGVVGAGIAGLGAAWLLSRQHEVVLIEAQARLGGHTHTHEIERWGRSYQVDSGFIVFNPANYPLLTRLFDELGVESQPTTMSFSVRSERTGIEYNAGDLRGLFCQMRNLVSPRFWGMIGDIKRFYREAPRLLALREGGPALGDWLREHDYGEAFIEEHLVPMASALWSSPSAQVLQFPAKYLVQFMANHHMLQIDGRPQWRVVKGGSSSYVRAMQARWAVRVRSACPVQRVTRMPDAIQVVHAQGVEAFDHVVMACHPDRSLALLAAPTPAEREVLGAITYQRNDAVLHTDARLLPRNRRAWAAWNAHIPVRDGGDCTVSYCMNLLQSLDSPEPFVVTLNRTADIDPAKIIARMEYDHPVYTRQSVAAQSRRDEIDGVDRISYAGAWWGWGFHEDGLRSAVAVANRLGVHWP